MSFLNKKSGIAVKDDFFSFIFLCVETIELNDFNYNSRKKWEYS